MNKVRVLIGLLVAFALLSGCRGGGEKKAAAPSGPPHGGAKQDQGQTPYYYGLIEEYQTVLAEDPHNLAATIALGNAFYDAGRWKEAIMYYERALRINPHNADVLTDMGTSFRNLGMPDRAIAEYRRALMNEPAHQNALYNLGIVYAFDNKAYHEAIRAWDQLLQVAPKHPKADYIRTSMAHFKDILRKRAR